MEQYNYMPIGTVVSYAGATTPIGWLLCDGRTIEEHEYPDLYRVLGSGILPDLRGEFGQIIKAFNTTTDTETLPIQMAKALNNKIENNYNDQLDATVDIVGKEFYDYIQNSGEKTAGKIYRDRLQKGIFRCLKTTTSVLNTSEFYESVSNNDLGNKLQNLGNEQYVCIDYPYSLMINTAGFELISDTRLNHVIRATKKGKYIITSTMRSSSPISEDCSIGISKNNDYYSVAFTLMAGASPSVFEMTPSITRVVSLNPGDIIDILRTKAEPSKPQRVISILKI